MASKDCGHWQCSGNPYSYDSCQQKARRKRKIEELVEKSGTSHIKLPLTSEEYDDFYKMLGNCTEEEQKQAMVSRYFPGKIKKICYNACDGDSIMDVEEKDECVDEGHTCYHMWPGCDCVERSPVWQLNKYYHVKCSKCSYTRTCTENNWAYQCFETHKQKKIDVYIPDNNY